jgi:UbiD family decarboxylase
MAAIQDLRAFLEVLEKNGQLLHITEEVQLEPDIGAAGRAISQLGEKTPALSFEKIKGYKKPPDCHQYPWIMAESGTGDGYAEG